MNSRGSANSDLDAPIPTRQFFGFLIFFHVVFLGILVFTLFAHLRGSQGPLSSDLTLIGLVAAQCVLYLCFFAIPSVARRWRPTRRFKALLERINEPRRRDDWAALIWLGIYIGPSVALVVAACRIEPNYQWVLLGYVGQISALRLRIAVPAAGAILIIGFLNQFGWSNPFTGHVYQWLLFMLTLTALFFFFARTLVTSGERGKLIVELETAKRELELAGQRDAELAVLRERERLARDLHDTLGHAVVTLTVQLEAAQRLLPVDADRAGALLGEMQKLTRSSMEDLRRSLANLRAPGLGERRFSEAVQACCADTGKRLGLQIACHLHANADALPPAVAEALWRVVQEGLTNIEKHAHARRVEVTLKAQPRGNHPAGQR